MKQLSKDQQKERDELLARFEKAKEQLGMARTDLEGEIDAFNEQVQAMNDIIGDIQSFVDTVQTEITDYIGERSEKWQESDRGQAYANWQEEWQYLNVEEMDTLSVEFPEVPDIDEFAQAASAPEE